MRKRPARTVLEVCIARGGVWRGAKVQTFIGQWAIASQAMGRPITVADYAEWWRESERTVYRHQAQFRELFPELETPQPIADAAIAKADQWLSRGVSGFGELPAGIVTA